MAPLSRPRLTLRLVPIAALLLALVVAVGPVAAAPTVSANPALVPFDPTPGKPGTTTLTFNADGTSGLTACGQDNAQPAFALGAVDPAKALVVPFPFIQAGKYTFWESADSGCAGAKLGTATATRLGPTGKAGLDDIVFTSGTILFSVPISSPTSIVTEEDVNILGTGSSGQQTFPIPKVQLCFMSADGAQVAIAMKVGQDSRSGKGLGSGAATTTVNPVSAQNGCFDIPWIVNGGYTATIARSGANATYGFCTGAGLGDNKPSNPPTATIGKCAQVAFSPIPKGVPFSPGTRVNGSIVTGADNHAVQVCVAAFSPGPAPANQPVRQLANTVNSYNQSGAVNLTELKFSTFPANTTVTVATYDITGPGPGGQGGTQFTCPTATAFQAGSAITIAFDEVPNATIIDGKIYRVS